MKRMFTLLFALGIFAAAQAQPGDRDKRDKDDRKYEQRDREYDDEDDQYDNDRSDRYENNNGRRNGNHNGNSRFGEERRMRMQIAQVNREYDYRIQEVNHDRYLSGWEREKQQRLLEDQRRQEIRRIYQQYKYRQRYDDRDNRDRRYNN